MGKVVPVYAMMANRRCRSTAPLILNLGGRWKCVVNTSRRFNLRGNDLGTLQRLNVRSLNIQKRISETATQRLATCRDLVQH